MQRRRRDVDPLAAYRGRANAATGAAAEAQFAAELERYGGVVWRPAANTSRRWNRDVWGLFDGLCLTGMNLLAYQSKATETDPWPPAPVWRARFLALPKPPCCRFLLAWLTPSQDWMVWRLLADGTRLPVAWPPERTAS